MSTELKKVVFENMDSLYENVPEFCSEDSENIVYDMHYSTECFFEYCKVDAMKYIDEWKKLNLKKISNNSKM
jgi:hypothetical protein